MKALGEWEGLETARLESGHVEDLLSGRVPYVRLPAFLDPAHCEKIVRRFLRSPFETRDYGASRTLQVGMALAPMFQREYFSRSRELNAAVESLYRGFENPALKLREAMKGATGWTSLEPVEDGIPYCSNMVLAMPPSTDMPLHCDLSKEEPGLFVSRFPRQFSWNVYLEVAESGGELAIYKRAYRVGDEKLRMPGRLDYHPSVIDGAELALVRPRPGDLVILDSYHYHRVLATGGARHRVTSHSFISVDPAKGEMAFWT